MTTHGYVGDCREQRSLDVIKTTMEQINAASGQLSSNSGGSHTEAEESAQCEGNRSRVCKGKIHSCSESLNCQDETFDGVHGWW